MADFISQGTFTPATQATQTKLNVRSYIENGGQACPFCGADTLEGASINIEEGAARQEMFCLACGEEWADSHHLAAVIYDGKVIEPANQPEEEAATIFKTLKDLLASLEGIEDLEHDVFSCDPAENCTLCAAKDLVAKLDEKYSAEE